MDIPKKADIRTRSVRIEIEVIKKIADLKKRTDLSVQKIYNLALKLGLPQINVKEEK